MSKSIRVKSYIRNGEPVQVKQQGSPELMGALLGVSLIAITCNWIAQLLR